jgi:hypothetical protein
MSQLDNRPAERLRDLLWLDNKMRIAHIAPLAESVPPKLYGGTERVIAWLTEELIDLGHQVTLFASGDSSARGLHPVSKTPSLVF